jgi:hypothetical protein
LLVDGGAELASETKELRLLRRYERENDNKYMRLSKELGLKAGPSEGASVGDLFAPEPTPCPEPYDDGPSEDRQPGDPTADVDAVRDDAGVTTPHIVRTNTDGSLPAAYRDEAGDGPCGSHRSSGLPAPPGDQGRWKRRE